ncbi:hypothetical protein EVJ58_g3601 [Rhodofomes roseus]|uniref:LYR motif-containing protein Cup1-like N-terminal domain-containing protein n=1 Tax=Rhodofomes roseus TaxID=34475 RepID=A0A4Y9YMX5_9APHY|nr:hypothetical protein EVJ58_g3601 [Rhodofomes roseus]
MAADANAVFSLYRAFHREIRLLPTNYLRHFYKIKLGDDARALLRVYDLHQRAKRMKRVQKELNNLRLANRGLAIKFDHVLDLAYGRKGKLRWELLEPIMTDPASPLPDPIIPSVQASRPPVLSPELAALMTSNVSHKTKGIPHQHILHPPILPNRADPGSYEARILGPFSKRREVNIRRKYFNDNIRMIYPPLDVGVDREQNPTLHSQERRVDAETLQQAGVRPLALQGLGLFEEVLSLATTGRLLNSDEPAFANHHLSPRFLRRRFISLLRRLPMLTYLHPREQSKKIDGLITRVYTATLSPEQDSLHTNFAHETDVAWFNTIKAEPRARNRRAHAR